jgi:hypothetical protein
MPRLNMEKSPEGLVVEGDRHSLRFDDLAQFFHLPLGTACSHLGIGGTVFKKICRKNGIPRWPHRKLCSIDKTISTLEERITSESADEKAVTQAQIEQLKSEKHSIMTVAPGCPKDDSPIKRPTNLTFMQWEPNPVTKVTAPPTSTSSPFITYDFPTSAPSSVSPPALFSWEPPTDERPRRQTPSPPLFLEPNLDFQVTSYGLVRSWQLPSLRRHAKDSQRRYSGAFGM